MSKHKNHNYVNYYAKSTYEKENDNKSEAIVRYNNDEMPKIEAVIQELEPENPPEEKIEETRPVEAPPKFVELLDNIYIRETPYGDKVLKEDLDRILSGKVLKDSDGWAIVPKGTKLQIYDMFVHEDGSIWFNTRFGYLMAKNKKGKKYIE